jgi:AraC family transcriptional regulator
MESRYALQRTVAYIHQNLRQPLALADLSRVACLSAYHFSRTFKRSTGFSPHQYVLRARVDAARALLVSGRLSVAEIALHVGFFDQSHLARHFKRQCGVPPSGFLTRGERRFP